MARSIHADKGIQHDCAIDCEGDAGPDQWLDAAAMGADNRAERADIIPNPGIDRGAVDHEIIGIENWRRYHEGRYEKRYSGRCAPQLFHQPGENRVNDGEE